MTGHDVSLQTRCALASRSPSKLPAVHFGAWLRQGAGQTAGGAGPGVGLPSLSSSQRLPLPCCSQLASGSDAGAASSSRGAMARTGPASAGPPFLT